MDRRLVRQISALQGDQFNAQPGRVHGILLLFEGTNSTGVTADLTDLGSVVIKRDSRQIVNARMNELANMGDIRWGANLFSSTEASTFEASVFIPFYEGEKNDAELQNALAIVDDSELNIEWVPDAGISSDFDSITLSVLTELAAYPERYEYSILRDDQIESGSVAGKPYQLNKDNITGIYLEDPDDVVDLIQLEQGGKSVYSPQSWNTLLAGTLRDSRLETGSFDMVSLPTFTPNNFGSVVNRDSVLSVTTSGAGTLRVLTTNVHIWGRGRKGRGNRA